MPPAARPPPLSVPSCAIRVRRPRLARRLSQASAGLQMAPPLWVVAAIINSALGDPVSFHYLAPHCLEDAIVWILLAGPLVLAAASALVGGMALARSGQLEVDNDFVRVNGGPLITADRIEAGIVVPTMDGPAVDLHLRDGRVLRVGIENEAEAQAVLERLGIGPDRRRVALSLGHENRSLLLGIVAYPVAVFAWILVLSALEKLTGTTISDGFVAVAAFVVALCTPIARILAGAPTVVVGADGVLLQRPRGSQRLCYAAIERASANIGDLVLDLRDGARLVLHGNRPPVAMALADRIQEAMVRAGREERHVAATRLDPEGRRIGEWRTALRRLVRGAGDYRGGTLGVDDLLGVLDDASAPPPRRLGAALALRECEVPEARSRVRIAADACADEEVRAALEAAGAEEIDEGPIRRVLERR